MTTKECDQDERDRRLDAVSNQLSRHERQQRLVLLLVVLLNLLILMLVVSHLSNLSWDPRSLSPHFH